MNQPNPKIRKGRKYDQVVDGARLIFLRDGFDGASVDEIAREAGVSKATLYSYFPDKRLLFMEVSRTECVRQAEIASERIDMSAPLAEVLRAAATQIIDIMSSTFNRRMYRMCVAESERFPQVGKQFYEFGPNMVRNKISKFLEAAIERGDLEIEDVALAADQFHVLCKADLMDRALFELKDDITDAEKARVVEGAVTMFLARYAKR
ncbi:HTH-type transcriptional repressor AcnR [Aquimixticola soesokkakensis]|uniref:HTH-type transcriptional repressor AcnR n=1 Tax=Aquimixticola soesokkakensis TaxID=1519096 RepID=A0A1Y5RF36_9RHOB|nr:TetR/AcrR family transcriptional regulator [Aquimixticola soesokkakensis]SLN16004.1 HTH-type transcriptional repressor AcnR [Aquimixticola soesokkakensis]